MRLIFMGTPDFAAVSLRALIEAGHEIALAVTQPDRQKGRSGALSASSVKETALSCGIPVFQPERLRDEENIKRILDTPCDAIVVASFGQILPKEILDYPEYGCINVHASLLPRYRGAAPVQWAILNGEEKTGISIMQMGEGLDDGDVLYVKELPIRDDHTGGTLLEELSGLGARALVEALASIDSLTPVPQDHSLATHVGKIKKSQGRLDFSRPAREIERYIRGLDPWPSAYTQVSGRLVKLWKARVLGPGELPGLSGQGPGSMMNIDGRLIIKCGDGCIEVLEVQPEGKRRMAAGEFLRGYRI